MSTNNTDTPTAEQSSQTPPGVSSDDLGEGVARIDVDEETYQRVHDAYLEALEHGYSDGFEVFAFNHLSTEYVFTVDGEPVDPDFDTE